ncbi:MAG: UvrD-helicase domain-containing protein [Bacteroidetes bacterium]|nr:UvrD-helicase domain-containing protein [Bacteroidota bacterium]
MAAPFHLYRSSAGSGKTRTLAKEYLKLALQFRSDYFKHILAVTFTNKSTQEMKNRILHYLQAFVSGKENELATELQQELNLDTATFLERAREVQQSILHGYHHFSISTIDAFFQRVIRSFTREAGILGDYRLEVEHKDVMETVIANLIAELGRQEQLTDWVLEFALQNLENDKSWDMRQSLLSFSEQIFNEAFKAIEEEVRETTSSHFFFKETHQRLQSEKFQFIHYCQSRAQHLLAQFKLAGLTVEDFKYKSQGSVFSFVKKISELNSASGFKEIPKRIGNELLSIENWFDKKHPQYGVLTQRADNWVHPFNEIITFREKNLKKALTAEVLLKEFYAFGLLTDVLRKLNEYKLENNVMVLADAAHFLNKIIDNSDTPFVYEKTGSFYRNYLIDEFQDTSGLQWKNFKPLMSNSLDSGYPCLIVGDVKQAIYRWRGGDQDLLQHRAMSELGQDRTKVFTLDKNFRSNSSIVDFNNQLFESMASILSKELGIAMDEYSDVKQIPVKTDCGITYVKWVASTETTNWKQVALEQTALKIEELQQQGIAPGDIAFLARTNKEGAEIISYLAQRKNSALAKTDCVYEVISNDSLRIDNASSVNLIVAAMTYLLNHEDTLARAQLAYEYARIHQPDQALDDVFSVAGEMFDLQLPHAFAAHKISLRKLLLFELTETLIEIFSLKNQIGELSHLLAFQDLVLNFAHQERNDLPSFLVWWADNKQKKFIKAPIEASAMSLFTLHKAKGLQFKYVIIPFCSWRIDHDPTNSPLLWQKSVHAPFSELGFFPVKYSSSLKDTFLKEAYEAEHARTYLDNLNLLYVAFTRAENGLIVFAPAPNEKIFNSSVAGWVHKAMGQSPGLAEGWNEELLTYQAGVISTTEISSFKEQKTVLLNEYITQSWRNKLLIKKSPQPGDTQPKQRMGIWLHAALAQINYVRDVERALFDLENNGDINLNEKEQLKKNLYGLLAHPQVADWFSEKWNVQTEVSAWLPVGKELRIDRLLTQGRQAIVIDYKSGNPAKSDHDQVMEYGAVLNEMGFHTEGFLLYLNEEKIEVKKVFPKKSKTKNQLGLDF